MSNTPKGFQRIDVSCRLYFVAEVESTLLEHGSGFLMHVLEQQALNLLKSKDKKQHQDFHLSVISTVCLPTTAQVAAAEETVPLRLLGELLKTDDQEAWLAQHREEISTLLRKKGQ